MKYILISILTISFFTQIQASFYASCELEVKVMEIQASRPKKSKNGIYILKTSIIVLKFVKGNGHTDDYCKDFPTQKEQMVQKDIEKVKKGAEIKVFYETASGKYPKGHNPKTYFHETWSFQELMKE